MTKHQWHPAPARGTKNRLSEFFKYTVVRLDDSKERFSDRKPRKEVCSSYKFIVWNNRENYRVGA